MEWAFFGIFAIVMAMIFNFINPKIMGMTWAQSPTASGYVGRTLVTAVAFFVTLALAAFIMSAVVGRKAAEIPTA